MFVILPFPFPHNSSYYISHESFPYTHCAACSPWKLFWQRNALYKSTFYLLTYLLTYWVYIWRLTVMPACSYAWCIATSDLSTSAADAGINHVLMLWTVTIASHQLWNTITPLHCRDSNNLNMYVVNPFLLFRIKKAYQYAYIYVMKNVSWSSVENLYFTVYLQHKVNIIRSIKNSKLN